MGPALMCFGASFPGSCLNSNKATVKQKETLFDSQAWIKVVYHGKSWKKEQN